MVKPVSKKRNTRPQSRANHTTSPEQLAQANAPAIRALLDQISDSFLALDRQWRCTYINQHTEQLFGLHKAALLGKVFWEVYPEAVGTLFYHKYHEAMRTQQPVSFEAFYPTPEKWYAVRAYPSPESLSLYITDITQRKQIGVELRESEERFRAIWEHALDAMALSDPEGIVLMANPAYYQFYGYTPQEVIGKSYAIIFPEEQRAWAMGAYRATFEQAAIEPAVEVTVRRKNGVERVVEARYHFVLENGERSAMVSVVRDITEQKRVQEALARMQLRAQRLMESNIIGVFIADEDHILESNDAFLEIIGYNREDLDHRRINWSAMTPPNYAPLGQKALQDLQERGACTPFEKEYIRKDGSPVPILIGAARLQEEPLQWVCFVLDISERKALEERKDAFLGMVSHELKTPLSNIWILTHLLSKQLTEQGFQDRERNLVQLGLQARQLMKLLTEVLEVSQLEAGYLLYAEEPFDVNSLVQEVVSTLQQVTPDHAIVVSGTADTVVIGDRDRIGQVVTNLLTNAIKYSVGTSPIDVLLAASDEALTMRVRDYGLGIPPEQQQRIFERFYRTQNRSQGSPPGFGMGLYISREIVKRHGGRITVVSEVGKGSTFSVVLPIAKGEAN